MPTHKVVKHDEWLAARKRHLAKEKEFTRLRDQLSRERRNLPWELVEKQYTFEGEHGTQTLSDLFEGRSQLVIYHAMFHPDTGVPYPLDTGRALLRLLLLDGQLQRRHRPSEPPRHHHGRGLTGPLREACRLQEADGLGLSVAVIVRQRLQLRLSRLFHRRKGREGRLQLPAPPVGTDRGTRYQRVPEGWRPDLPHVLHL